MPEQTILLIDDEPHIIELAQMYLEKEGFTVYSAGDGQTALEQIAARQPDLIVLDLMLPQIDGWQVCRRVRAGSDVPIIMLTARDDAIDKIVGLELGADAYLTKPFNPRELVAWVRAILRRTTAQKSNAAPGALTAGQLAINAGSRQAFVNGQALTLRNKEFDLLLALIENKNLVLSREKLLDLVWGFDFYGQTRTVDVHIAHLRDKLTGSDVEIETVWGVGYKLTAG